MASADQRLVFLDPHTMAVQKSVPVPCAGVNHADFAADGRTFVVSCEFSGQLLLVDTAAEKILQVAPAAATTQDAGSDAAGREART